MGSVAAEQNLWRDLYPDSKWVETQHSSGRNTTSWVDEPPIRGTFRLLISCLATLSLCVYSALHLNLLPPPKSPLKREQDRRRCRDTDPSSQPSAYAVFSNKVTWVLIGMFAPEFVVYTAWSQWRTANKLTEAIKKNMVEARDMEWTMTHSFFALMGGFVVDTDDPGEDAFIDNSPRLHLTANGVAMLAEVGQLPLVSEGFIRDKSKGDHFTKALVLVQAGWLVIECISRLVSHLPLSQLEINTMAHIGCAMITYALWWNKPLDVSHPVVLKGEWKRPLVAAMAMFSQQDRSSPPETETILHYRTQSPANSTPADLSSPLKILRRRPKGIASPEPQRLALSDNDSCSSLVDGPKITLHEGDVLLPFGFSPKPHSTQFRWEDIFDSKPPIRLDPDLVTLTRWSLACQSLSEHPTLWSKYSSVVRASERHGTAYLVHEYPESKLDVDFVCAAIPNWPHRDLIPHHQKYTPVVFFSVCVIFYGGIHTAAWNDYFPSANERLLWKMSSLYVAGSGFLWLVLRMLQVGVEKLHNSFVAKGRAGRSWVRTPLGAVLMMVPLYVVTAAGCGYVVARVYLVVEAFLSLRDVPLEVYVTPEWSRYLVHL